jgi:predicted Rossmann fold flavoprotein
MNHSFDIAIIGAGAAGLLCALTAAQRGRSVVLLDHSAKLAEKIRISGGGRCNFTNLNVKPENYLSDNPHFVRSALARYTPQHFIAMLDEHDIRWSEKELGQLFCDDSSEAVIKMLKDACEAANVRRYHSCEVHEIKPRNTKERFEIISSRDTFHVTSLVIATGGLSIPKTGATPFGYKVAEQFGLPIVKLRPGLVPLTFRPDEWQPYSGLSGLSFPAEVSFGKQSFRNELLFTHRGLSGPAILQISSYWEHGQPLSIDLLPGRDMQVLFEEHRSSKMLMSNFIGQYLPKRFAEVWLPQFGENLPVNQWSPKKLSALAEQVHHWRITPSGTQGYTKAEVTCGGVDTRALSSKTMEANAVPGLYFIGEVIDVTGQLGGYNFQWAWASGHAAGMAA